MTVQDTNLIIINKECARRTALASMRKQLKKEVATLLGFKVPNEAFNGWLFESLAYSAVVDGVATEALIPTTCLAVSGRLKKVLLLKYPCSYVYLEDDSNEELLTQEYLEAARKVLPKCSHEKLQAIAANIKLQAQGCGLYDGVRQAAKEMLLPQLEEVTSQLCSALLAAAQLQAQNLACWVPEDITVSGTPPVTVTVQESQVVVTVTPTQLEARYRGSQTTQYKINLTHYNKLKRLATLRQHSNYPMQPAQQVDFETALWCVLHRYHTLFGPSGEGSGWQLGTPTAVMQLLEQQFGVSHECFASPLNCNFSSFCSLFPDTDSYFGSRGNFFNFDFSQGGSYEAGPPYDDYLMGLMADKLLQALEASGATPLSFVCVLPHWLDCPGISAMHSSRFHRGSIVLPKGEHRYISGFQHFCQERHHHVMFECTSYICWLQNDSGAAKWPATQDKIDMVAAAWRAAA